MPQNITLEVTGSNASAAANVNTTTAGSSMTRQDRVIPGFSAGGSLAKVNTTINDSTSKGKRIRTMGLEIIAPAVDAGSGESFEVRARVLFSYPTKYTTTAQQQQIVRMLLTALQSNGGVTNGPCVAEMLASGII